MGCAGLPGFSGLRLPYRPFLKDLTLRENGVEVKYSLCLIPVPGEKESVLSFELRKAQSLHYLGCFFAHVLPEL